MSYRSASIHIGDALSVLKALPDESVQTCVTSPPYFGLRNYGADGQIGLEPTPAEFVQALVAVFREVRRVLRGDGTCWINLGDSYAGSWGARGRGGDTNAARPDLEAKHGTSAPNRNGFPELGVKKKDLIGIPWRVAFALQDDGWYLRQDIIWSKTNPMPASVTDRCTTAHEYIFLLSKSPRYYYDHEAIKEPLADSNAQRTTKKYNTAERYGANNGGNGGLDKLAQSMRSGNHTTRNKRSVWTVSTKPYKEAHFATFPPDLIRPCILAGAPEGATVLDPFTGAGTTGLVSLRHRRNFVGIELNPTYARMAEERIRQDAPLFNQVSVVGSSPEKEVA